MDDQSTEDSGVGNFSEQLWGVLRERGHLGDIVNCCQVEAFTGKEIGRAGQDLIEALDSVGSDG